MTVQRQIKRIERIFERIVDTVGADFERNCGELLSTMRETPESQAFLARLEAHVQDESVRPALKNSLTIGLSEEQWAAVAYFHLDALVRSGVSYVETALLPEQGFSSGAPEVFRKRFLVPMVDRLVDHLWDSLAENSGGAMEIEEAKKGSTLIDEFERTVFVIHGQNQNAATAMFNWLRCVELKPLEWEEAVRLTEKGSPTTLETVEAGLKRAKIVIAFFTDDEQVRLRPELVVDGNTDQEFRYQPRPNVLFEAGLACASGGLERTIFVELGTLRDFSDIDGLNRIRLGTKPSAKDLKRLKDRLETALGFELKATGTHWLDADAFAGAVLSPK